MVRESVSYPPPDGELKQHGEQATPAGAREHLPQAPELAGSSAQPELPRRRTARRRGRSRREGGRRRAGIRASGCRLQNQGRRAFTRDLKGGLLQPGGGVCSRAGEGVCAARPGSWGETGEGSQGGKSGPQTAPPSPRHHPTKDCLDLEQKHRGSETLCHFLIHT